MEWKTRVTELLGCKYPILMGAIARLGNWQFAAAVADTGAYGTITASVLHTPEKLREEIKRCRAATNGAFGVNLSFGSCPDIDQMLEICIEEGIPVETAAYKPDALVPRIKESGITWIHKGARVKDVVHAAELGADAVIVVGREGVGIKSPEQLTTMITTTWAVKELEIPVIASGGIGDARGFLGALGMGAEGIMMGTAFMVTKECPMKEAAKQAIAGARPDDPRLRTQILDTADPIKYAEIMKLRGKIPFDEWMTMVRKVNRKDPQSDPALKGSLAVAVIDRVQTVKELIDGIINQAEELLENMNFLKTK